MEIRGLPNDCGLVVEDRLRYDGLRRRMAFAGLGTQPPGTRVKPAFPMRGRPALVLMLAALLYAADLDHSCSSATANTDQRITKRRRRGRHGVVLGFTTANTALLQEYFTTSVGQVRKVELSYGPGGISRGIATVTFSHADGASKAFSELNGLLIDNRPIKVSSCAFSSCPSGRLTANAKVEVVVASAELIPQPKTLAQRLSQPKPQPKSAANDKRGGNAPAKAGAATNGAKKVRKGRTARPLKKKTAEELDSEMADYFTGTEGTTAAAAGAAPAATNGDAPMEAEIE